MKNLNYILFQFFNKDNKHKDLYINNYVQLTCQNLINPILKLEN